LGAQVLLHVKERFLPKSIHNELRKKGKGSMERRRSPCQVIHSLVNTCGQPSHARKRTSIFIDFSGRNHRSN
jgi:hypothetical protein